MSFFNNKEDKVEENISETVPEEDESTYSLTIECDGIDNLEITSLTVKKANEIYNQIKAQLFAGGEFIEIDFSDEENGTNKNIINIKKILRVDLLKE